MNHIKLYRKHYSIGEQDLTLCEVCGTVAVDIHHIKFKSQGGKDEIDNLIALCRQCHDKAHRYEYSQEYLKERQKFNQIT